jgi:ABC-type polysaccharide/polyol phosphate transport system ATPase subunit
MDIGLHLKTFNEKLRYLNKNLVNSENTDLEKEFEELFKITLNMEYLHENNIISIAGLQGVGKSSLIQKIYDIPR